LNGFALDELRRLAASPKVVAIGEIGLDYYRNLSPRETQKKAFETQLFLAEELELPVVIHNREAHVDTARTLSKFKGRIKVIMHCFTGSREMAEEYIKAGFYVSFAGPISYPNSHELRKAAERANLSKILLETDSPWLAPQNMRGKRNEPAFLPFIAEKIAELKGISVDELSEATTENAKEAFQLS
jgi:TatD DNase family protein